MKDLDTSAFASFRHEFKRRNKNRENILPGFETFVLVQPSSKYFKEDKVD